MPHGKLGIEKQTTPKATRRPTLKDLAWAAGYLEGEACFSRTNSSEMVQVVSTDREPLEYLQEIFGGSIGPDYKPKNPKHSPCNTWRVYGARARGIMQTMYSLLAPRRQRKIKEILYGSY
jgi:hypothetical protein